MRIPPAPPATIAARHDRARAYNTRGGFFNSEMLCPLLCERLGVPYLGANPILRGLADDKHLTKLEGKARGVPTLFAAVFNTGVPQLILLIGLIRLLMDRSFRRDMLPKLSEDVGHVDIAQAAVIGGWMFAAFSLAQFVFAPLMGNLADRFGRRPLLLLAIFGLGMDFILMALAPTLGVGVVLVAMTGRAESSLARHADWVLDTAVAREACPHNLAPTASTTAQLALGDALAVALLDARGFRADDFARSHPGGALGRRLLTHVADVMRQGDAVPRVAPGTPLMDLMREISAKGLGMSAIVDAEGRVLGIFTDGDLRRLIERGTDLRALTAGAVMHPGPKLVRDDALAVDAAELMERHRITSVLVVDADGALVGALNSNDLMRAKVI